MLFTAIYILIFVAGMFVAEYFGRRVLFNRIFQVYLCISVFLSAFIHNWWGVLVSGGIAVMVEKWWMPRDREKDITTQFKRNPKKWAEKLQKKHGEITKIEIITGDDVEIVYEKKENDNG